MPVTIPIITSGSTISTTTVNDTFQLVEDFVNGGITASDIDTSEEWVKERHVVQPEFYGAPAPRTLMVSSDVHTRSVQDLDSLFVITNQQTLNFMPIPGLSATIYVDIDNDESSSTVVAIVNACFQCLEDTSLLSATNTTLRGGSEIITGAAIEGSSYMGAKYSLWVNDTEISNTRRFLYSNYGAFAQKNHTISAMVELNRGLNNISVRVQPSEDDTAYFYQIHTKERNLTIEVLYR
jgi:hypothetical protein|tara:strand:- start:8468 stop:9178 length:711 start_codon:yes stop_codon:yes gene_type:complete